MSIIIPPFAMLALLLSIGLAPCAHAEPAARSRTSEQEPETRFAMYETLFKRASRPILKDWLGSYFELRGDQVWRCDETQIRGDPRREPDLSFERVRSFLIRFRLSTSTSFIADSS